MNDRLLKFGSRPLLLALTLALAVTASAAAHQRFSSIKAFETDIWTIWVPIGSSRVVVDGDGHTDLDCYVYDPAGRLLGKDDGGTDYCHVDLRRSRAGNLKVHIVNLGSAFNRYELRLQ